MLFPTLLLVVALAAFYYFRGAKRTNLPPGPPFCLPILGHLPFLGDAPNRTFLKWSKSYGPIISIQLGSYPAVVINDGQLIRKAFNMSSLSGRPHMKFFDEVSGQRRGVISSDGPRAMEQRKFIQKLLKSFGFGTNANAGPILDQVPDLLEVFEEHLSKPLNVKHAFNHAILNAIWSVVVGDHFEKNSKEFQKLVSIISNGANLSNPLEKLSVFIKFLHLWLPELSGFNKKIRGFSELQKYIQSLIKEHERTKSKNQPRDLIDAYLDEVEKTTDPQSGFFRDHGNIAIAMQDLFIGGVETSSTTLEWILFYLAKYPKVQEKLQKEIDPVLGKHRLPCSDDRVKLHYAQAVIEEVSRIASIVPLALFHSAMEDTEFNGYLIPKGIIIVGNLFGAHHDEDIWGDPEMFRPERFLDSDGNFIKSNDVMPFSFGKRSCVGNHLAKLQLFLFTVSIFQRFSVKPVGELPPESGMFGFTLSVHPFQVHVSTRERN